MAHLEALPYWARIGSAVSVIGVAYFLASAVITAVAGPGTSDTIFDLLLAGAFMLLAFAIAAKASPRRALDEGRLGPLDY